MRKNRPLDFTYLPFYGVIVDRDSLENYRPPGPAIETVDGDRLRIFCGDEIPPIGSAVGVDIGDRTLWAVVDRHIGARRIAAWLPLCPDEVTPGMAVEISHCPAGFEFPDENPLRPTSSLLRPAAAEDILFWSKAPRWSDLDTTPRPLPVGLEPIDTLCAIARGGINLIVDHSEDRRGCTAVAHLIRSTLAAPRQLFVTDQHDNLGRPDQTIRQWRIDSGATVRRQIPALQIAIAMAAELRKSTTALALIDLPRLQSTDVGHKPATGSAPPAGLPEIIDRLGHHLASTKEVDITTVLCLHVPPSLGGLADIIETLRLGDVDTTLVIDADHRFDPSRSHSTVDLDAKTERLRQRHRRSLQLADKAKEKRAIFGDHDLTDAEKRALDEEGALRPLLVEIDNAL